MRRGKNYSVNVPLKNGMTDETYRALFRPIMSKVMQIYQPEAIVFQSGEASLPMPKAKSEKQQPMAPSSACSCMWAIFRGNRRRIRILGLSDFGRIPESSWLFNTISTETLQVSIKLPF